ncbi:DUF2807 domain-containing protein [Lutibacter sp. HS1-25]|uniref:head GIN domain-containing protein n=1 Tax=Lutibacter sp. HS1-25 TaxID=2485000 RepID=UPI001012C601|nr:head GIN domain-containing protein [Lutibacter sp. HS1-25]RXP57889.1 DUF2807 domain-containing protein [Lutibacter sp. HS1-25]
MLKKIIYIITLILIGSCNSENANNCFQTAGKTTQKEVDVPFFDKVVVHEHISLIITQGDTQKVIVETGENLQNDISVEIINNELILKNHNTCNFIREYDLTKIYITVPNLTRIRNASEFNVTSNGVLTYPTLYLMSVGDKSRFLSVGDWYLNIKNQSVSIWGNGIAVFNLEGTTNKLDINFSDGDTRFEGKNFKAQNINVKQVSSNDMVVYPIQSLTGTIHSTGNVISYNQPPTVTLEALGNYGKLIFK